MLTAGTTFQAPYKVDNKNIYHSDRAFCHDAFFSEGESICCMHDKSIPRRLSVAGALAD